MRTHTTTYAELKPEAGPGWEDVRLTLATKMAYERTARVNRWTSEDNPFTTAAFFAWHAGKIAGAHDLEWEPFLSVVIDAGVEEGEDAGDALAGADPTPPGV